MNKAYYIVGTFAAAYTCGYVITQHSLLSVMIALFATAVIHCAVEVAKEVMKK